MDSLLIIRQMMAEAKFFDAQILIEARLSGAGAELRPSLITSLLECLVAQSKDLPELLILELVTVLSLEAPDMAIVWFERIKDKKKLAHRNDFKILQLFVAEKKGNLDQLRSMLLSFQVSQIEDANPAIPEVITDYCEKYFKYDWELKLQKLTLLLAREDLLAVEDFGKELMLSLLEKSNLKDNNSRWIKLYNLLSAPSVRGSCLFLRNYCLLYLRGAPVKKDYKVLAELVIHFDDFKLQVMLLHLISKLGLDSLAPAYAKEIRQNKSFDLTYLDKHFSELKSYFGGSKKVQIVSPVLYQSPDLELSLSSQMVYDKEEAREVHHHDDQEKLIQLFKYNDLASTDLCEIAVSFLQSDYPFVAHEAAHMAVAAAKGEVEYLKAAYLKIVSLMQMGNYRSALDFSMDAIRLARTQDDIMSILYSQAEAHIKLRQTTQARSILRKIIKIDANYRLSKQRLEKLDEI